MFCELEQRSLASIRRTIAIRVSHMANQKGWTQRALAWHSGLHEVTIHKILAEKHVIMPTFISILSLAMALDVSVDWVIGRKAAAPKFETKKSRASTK